MALGKHDSQRELDCKELVMGHRPTQDIRKQETGARLSKEKRI